MSLQSSGKGSEEVNTIMISTTERKTEWQRIKSGLMRLESPFRGRVIRSLPNKVELIGGRKEEKSLKVK